MVKMRKMTALLLALLLVSTLFVGCETGEKGERVYSSQGQQWYFGFGSREILPPEGEGPLYIAGYNNGVEITGVKDYCQARAVWLDTGGEGILLIGIDCIALDSGTVGKIRQALKGVANCAAIHVYATHTHAGIDTLGLWGPVGVNGKNEGYMDALVTAAAEAGQEAAAGRKAGRLYYGAAETENMLWDSRNPQVYDPMLHQLRFAAEDGSAGVRMFFYGAHAEALRGANTLLSKDYPGWLCSGVTKETGDDTIFFPGAIGGLIMTETFVPNEEESAGAMRNLLLTGEKLIGYALSIDSERELLPTLALSTGVFTVPMDNGVFLLYRMLGILGNKTVKMESATGYGVETELSVMRLGDIAIGLIPGEIFPELVYGGEFGNEAPEGVNPPPLAQLAAEQGLDTLLIIGLANDELGYIVPPSDFVINEKLPYVENIEGYRGENHYEETNSVGPQCAVAVADAFAAALELLPED